MIVEPRPNGRTITCPACRHHNEAEAFFCRKCGAPLDHLKQGANRPAPRLADAPQAAEPTMIVPPRPRPSLAQQCPSCGELNRHGVILCESCGTNLLTGERPPITTRAVDPSIDFERYAQTPIVGKETFKVDQPTKMSKGSTGVFDENMILRLQIDGADKLLLLKLRENHEVTIGRTDGAKPVDIDVTQYSGYRLGISRRHAAIQLIDQRLEVWDLNSSNGTYLNGNRLDPHHHHQLRDGDELRLGQMAIRVFFQQRIDR